MSAFEFQQDLVRLQIRLTGYLPRTITLIQRTKQQQQQQQQQQQHKTISLNKIKNFLWFTLVYTNTNPCIVAVMHETKHQVV